MHFYLNASIQFVENATPLQPFVQSLKQQVPPFDTGSGTDIDNQSLGAKPIRIVTNSIKKKETTKNSFEEHFSPDCIWLC